MMGELVTSGKEIAQTSFSPAVSFVGSCELIKNYFKSLSLEEILLCSGVKTGQA